MPILTTASDLLTYNGNLEELFKKLKVRFLSNKSNDLLLEIIEENDASILLLVDGLDEIGTADQKRVIQRLGSLIDMASHISSYGLDATSSFANNVGLVRHVVVSTRPVSFEILNEQGLTRSGFKILEIVSFDNDRINNLINQLITDLSTRDAFHEELRHVGWDRDDPTPLQIRVAAEIFRWDGALPVRSYEIAFRFVEKKLSEGIKRKFDITVDKVSPNYVLLQKNLNWIIEFFAQFNYSNNTFCSSDLESEINRLRALGNIPNDICNNDDLIHFILNDAPVITGLFWPSDSIASADGKLLFSITWIHRTFLQVLVACWHHRINSLCPNQLKELYDGALDDAVELNLLSRLEANYQFDIVEEILKYWVSSAPMTGGKTSKKALVALAAGIDADGRMRPSLVRELIRVVFDRIQQGNVVCRNIL